MALLINFQINLLQVQQYKHERECNAIIAQTREDKILRLEGLMDGVLSPEEFIQEEFASLAEEHKVLSFSIVLTNVILHFMINLKLFYSMASFTW